MTPGQSLTRQLVDHLAPALSSDQRQYAAEYVQKEVWSDTKGSSRREWVDVLCILNSATRVARVRVQENLADALRRCVGGLVRMQESGPGWEDDLPIQISNLPQHIQLLLNLSAPPTANTHEFAHAYLHRIPQTAESADQKLYDEIMAEPFTGEHWGKGYIEPEGRWTDSESSDDALSTTGDSGEDERIVTPLSARGIRREEEKKEQERKVALGEERVRRAKEALGRLASAYWNTGGVGLPKLPDELYGWKEIVRVANPAAMTLTDRSREAEAKTISAGQLQRELLFALSGRPGVIFAFDNDGTCRIKDDHPAIRFFSPRGLDSILDNVAHRATNIHIIRYFINEVQNAPSSSTPFAPSKTQQAFAEACRNALTSFEEWASGIELAFLRGASPGSTLPATPLALLKQLEEKFGKQLDDIVSLIPLSDNPSTLLNSIHAIYTSSSDPTSQTHTLDLLLRTAEPVWAALGTWLLNGMPLPRSLSVLTDDVVVDLDADEDEAIDPDLWFKRDRDVSWTDEDFWEAGYVVEEGGWPVWMGETQEMVLEAGKARGFLSGMMIYEEPPAAWKDLRRVFAPKGVCDKAINLGDSVEMFLAPICQITTFQLRRVFEEDCGLVQHLDAIEGTMFLKGHLSMTRWLDMLAEQIAKGKRWNDMSLLTAGLRDAIEETGEEWLNPSAIRVSPGRDGPKGTVKQPGDILKALGDLRVGYVVSFPLSVLFTSTTLDLRSQVFAFLVQLDYARRTAHAPVIGHTDLWRLRHRLVWFLQIIWAWLTDRVIAVQTQEYRDQLSRIESLRDMIDLELAHTRVLRDFAFQHERTADIREHIFAVMEISVSLTSTDDGEALGGSRRLARARVSRADDELFSGRHGSRENQYDAIGAMDVHQVDHEVRNRIAEVRADVEKLSAEGGGEAGEADQKQVWEMLGVALMEWPDV